MNEQCKDCLYFRSVSNRLRKDLNVHICAMPVADNWPRNFPLPIVDEEDVCECFEKADE